VCFPSPDSLRERLPRTQEFVISGIAGNLKNGAEQRNALSTESSAVVGAEAPWLSATLDARAHPPLGEVFERRLAQNEN
jgi:hypothetical protein